MSYAEDRTNAGMELLDSRRGASLDVNSWRCLATIWCAVAVAMVPLIAAPLIVDTYVDFIRVSARLAGFAFAVEAGGYAVGGLLFLFVKRLSPRRLIAAGTIAVCAGNIGATLGEPFGVVVACRAIAGIGSGLIVSMTITLLAASRSPDRNYGIWTLAQLLGGAAALFGLRLTSHRFGIGGIFLPIGIAALVLLSTAIRWLPDRFTTTVGDSGSRLAKPVMFAGLSALLGVFVYFGGQNAVWAYADQIALFGGVATPSIESGTFWSMGWAMAGALLATLIGQTHSRMQMLSGAMGGAAAAIALLFNLRSHAWFGFDIGVFNLSLYLCLPLIYALIADLDRTGKFAPALGLVTPASMSIGPAVAAALILANDLWPILWMGLLSLAVSLALFLPAAQIIRHREH